MSLSEVEQSVMREGEGLMLDSTGPCGRRCVALQASLLLGEEGVHAAAVQRRRAY